MKEFEVVVEIVCSTWEGTGATIDAGAGADADADADVDVDAMFGIRAWEGADAIDGVATGAAVGISGGEAAAGVDTGTSLIAGRAKEAKPVVEATCTGAGACRTASSSSCSTSISSPSIPNFANFLSFFSSSPSLVKKCNSRKAG